jgi:hypothetical protein
LFSERAVIALKTEIQEEVEFIPCMLKGQPLPVYAALFMKTASIVKDFEGMGFTFEDPSVLDVKYAVQDKNKGVKFVTSAFVDLVKKYDLKIGVNRKPKIKLQHDLFKILSIEEIEAEVLKEKENVQNFPKTIDFPFSEGYKKLVTAIKSTEIASEAMFYTMLLKQ